MSITIKNFKSYLNGPIEIKPITFVFGRNSSGKSALLQALNLLGQLEDKLFLPRSTNVGIDVDLQRKKLLVLS